MNQAATHASGFVFPVRIYYEDTDAGGVVFYANYLKFMERARTEWLRALDFHQQEIAEREQVIFVVRALDMDYRKPARLDDLLEIRSDISALGRASVTFFQQVWRDGELLTQGNIKVCCVNTSSMRPVPIPDALRATLASHVRPSLP